MVADIDKERYRASFCKYQRYCFWKDLLHNVADVHQ